MNIRNIFSKLKRKKVLIGVGILIILLAIFGLNREKEPTVETTQDAAPSVSLINLSQVGLGQGMQITASGNIKASQEANLVAETSGVVSNVHVSIGSYVNRGQALVTLSNADAVAQVAQAQAALTAAQSTAGSAEVNLENAAIDLLENIQSVERTIDDVRATKLAQFFSDVVQLRNFGVRVTSGNTTYTIEADPTAKVQIADKAREVISTYGALQEQLQKNGTQNAVDTVEYAESALHAMRELLELISGVLNRYSGEDSTQQTIYASLRADISSARTSISSAISSLSTALQTYRSTGTVNSAPAVEQARASLMAAQAQLAKTIIRAPFSGRVLSVTPQTGEFLAMGSPAVSLLSSDGKEVTLFLNAADAADVQIGSPVSIEGVTVGSIIRKAPGIDPATGKVEVVASLNSNDPSLAIGEFINVAIPIGQANTVHVRLPLKAVRMTGAQAEVLTIVDGLAVAHPVTTGALEGESIIVTSGLEGITNIIENVRGISPGDQVKASN